jgi:RHS repeat-associated protein
VPSQLAAVASTAQLGDFGLLSTLEGGGDGTEYLLEPSILGLQSDLFTGNGTFYYPIPVPALAGDLNLSLGLSYSSEEANSMYTNNGTYKHYSQASWAGLGWDLSGLGRIYRSGIDAFLSFGGGSYKLVSEGNNQWSTEPHSFLRILHEGGTTGRYHWDVWTPDGTHYVFGNPADAWGGGTAYSNWTTCDMNSERGYAWHLTRVYDTHANRIEVNYAHEYGNYAGCGSPYRTYIRATRPTGVYIVPTGSQATVRVVFSTETRNDWKLSLDGAADWPWDKATCADSMNTKSYYMFSCYRLSRVDVQAKQASGWFSVGSYDLSHVTIGNTDPTWDGRYYHIVLKHIQARGAATAVGGVGPLAPTQYTFANFQEGSWEINRSHLLSAQNGYGGQVSLTWEYFEKGYPLSCDPLPLGTLKRYRVIRREVSAGIGPSMVTTYDYNGSELTGCDPPVDYTTRFWGHGLVTANARRSDNSVARQEQTTFWQTNKVLRGKSSQSKILAPDDGGILRLLAQTDRAWSVAAEGWARLDETDEQSCAGGLCQSKRTTYHYDLSMQGGVQHGNLTRIIEYDENDVFYRATRRFFHARDELGANPPDTTVYIVNRVQTEIVSRAAVGLEYPDMVSLTWYTYDGQDLVTDPLGDHGDLTRVQRVQYDGASQDYHWFDTSDVTYTYDGYGNRVTETVYREPGRMKQPETSASVSWVSYPTEPLTTATSYDGYYHVFPLTVTDPLQHVTSSQYYGVNSVGLDHGSGGFFGQLKSMTDANGLITSYQYDQFGRLTKEIQPGDSVEFPSTSLGYNDTYYYNGFRGLKVTSSLREQSGLAEAIQVNFAYYDGLGRLVETLTERTNGGEQVLAYTTYDEMGRVKKEYVPYAVNADFWNFKSLATPEPAHTTFSYDGLGRTTQVTQPDGTTTQTSHGSWASATSDANGHSRLYRNDAFGRLQSVDENQDAVTFEDDFSTMNGDAWVFNDRQGLDGDPEDYAIKNTGTGIDWDASFYRSTFGIDGGEEGQGIQVEFKVDGGDTWAHFSLEAEGYRLGIVARDNKISVQYNAGAGWIYPADLIDPIAVDEWYVVRLKVTPEGSAYVEVWRKDDPGQRGIYALQMPAGVQYRFHHWIYSGNAWLDNYGEYDALVTTYDYDRLDNLTVVTDTLGITTTMQYDMLGRKEAMHDPDMGDWSYSYDALGNLLTQTDAKSQVIGFAYDGLNRLVEKDYGDDGTAEARYFYDGDTCTGCATPTGEVEGRQTAVWTAGSWAVYHYDDARGRLSSEERAIDGAPGGPFETEYTYDAMDRPVTMTMPDTEVITTTYNVAGLPFTLVGDTPYVSGTGYNALGQMTQLNMNSGIITTTYSYYPAATGNNRLQQIQVGGGSLLDLKYSYDDVGNVVQIVDGQTQTQTQSFVYDALDRLTGASAQAGGPWAAYSGSYEYDRVGNLTLKAEGGITHTMQYSDTAHVHAVSAVNGVAQTYDANGNMTERVVDGVTYTQGWDQENRLVWASTGGVTTTFSYDANGALVKKEDPLVGTTYYVGPHYEVLTESGEDPVVTKYYFHGGKRVAMDRDGVVQYLVGDHLGTTSIVLNDQGGVVAESRHYPYGEERWSSGTLPTDYRFTGQRSDSGLGLYFMDARQYDPALGRWISADTIVPESGSGQSYNRYAYVRNSPLNYVDPTGHMEDGECGRDGEQCGDDDLPPLPDWLIELLSDHPQLLDLLAMAPSAGGYYGSVSFSFGVILEVDVEIPVALMFNWHSGELTFLYGLGTDAHLGGPRLMSASVSGGNMWTWGASQNELLKGIDAYAGLDLQVDALAEAGGEVTVSRSLTYEDADGDGRADLNDPLIWAVDPRYGTKITSLQVGATAGVNAIPNGWDGGGCVGLSATEGFEIIPGWDSRIWPWNWFR